MDLSVQHGVAEERFAASEFLLGLALWTGFIAKSPPRAFAAFLLGQNQLSGPYRAILR